MSGLVAMWSVRCFMCGRLAGQLVDGVFVRDQRTRAPRVDQPRPRCGECQGNLYLEPEEPISPMRAAELRARGASPRETCRVAA